MYNFKPSSRRQVKSSWSWRKVSFREETCKVQHKSIKHTWGKPVIFDKALTTLLLIIQQMMIPNIYGAFSLLLMSIRCCCKEQMQFEAQIVSEAATSVGLQVRSTRLVRSGRTAVFSGSAGDVSVLWQPLISTVVLVACASHSQSQPKCDWNQSVRGGLVASEWSQALLKPRAHLASYPIALDGLYGLLAGGGAGAHAVYVLTVCGVAMVWGCTVASSAQGIPSTNTVAGVGERTGPAWHRGRHRRDHSPEQVAFMSWTWGAKCIFSSCRRLGWNQRRNGPDSGAF